MALTADTRLKLLVALANPGAAKELGDAVDAASIGTPVLAQNNTWAGTNTFTGQVSFKRFDAKQNTSHVIGDYALSGGFGTTASVALTAGTNDMRGQITVTSAGTGQGANPTITLTFKDGTFTVAPFAVVARNGGSQRTVTVDVTTTATTMIITFLGTPVAAETYLISFNVEG